MESKNIVKYARKIIEKHFEGKSVNLNLEEKGGVFVTLKKNGNLRGCIGVVSNDDLSKNLKKASIGVLNDPRFLPVRKEELENLKIEVSILKEPTPIKNPLKEIELGKHGLIIKKGFQTGLLLPQVAIEHNMTKEEFLEAVCEKAGIDKECWKLCQLFKFEADVFSEKD